MEQYLKRIILDIKDITKNPIDNIYYCTTSNCLIISDNKFFQQPYEVVFRSFSESIKIIGKKYYPVRGKKLDKVLENIEKNCLSKVTLGGCIIEKVNQTVIISKEH